LIGSVLLPFHLPEAPEQYLVTPTIGYTACR